MPRRPRLVLPGLPLHIIQRGNNREACFRAGADFPVYLSMLRAAAELGECTVHAYVLMTNHVHLLISPGEAESPGCMMKALGQRYVQYVNRRYGRSGTLWEGRFRSCIIEDERYFWTCQRYIELNPVRAGMVSRPGEYKWSSYHANADGVEDPIVTPHNLYQGLAADAPQRCSAYQELFSDELDDDAIDALRHATNGNHVIGGGEFMRRPKPASQRSAARNGS